MSGSATSQAVLLRHDGGGIATLTLNRGDARNALSRALMAALQGELDDIAADRAIRVVVLAAAGSAFCAGHDLRELRADPRREAQAAVFGQCSRLMLTLNRLPQPVIASIQGVATAAGCQLVATCDLAVASTEARFATPGVNIGLFCSTPMVALSRALPRKAALEMLLTGDMVDAETAARIGLINRAVPAAGLAAAVEALARAIAAKSSLTVATGKRAFYRQIDMDLTAAYDHASAVMTDNMMAHDAQEGIDAFLEKRAPRWRGC